jgi:hypothetical protein
VYILLTVHIIYYILVNAWLDFKQMGTKSAKQYGDKNGHKTGKMGTVMGVIRHNRGDSANRPTTIMTITLKLGKIGINS